MNGFIFLLFITTSFSTLHSPDQYQHWDTRTHVLKHHCHDMFVLLLTDGCMRYFVIQDKRGPKTPLFPVCLVWSCFLPILNVNSGKCSLSNQSTITQVLNFALTSPVKSNLPAHITQLFQWRS